MSDTTRHYAPHCDPTILHAPGTCEHCDHYPDWQQHRQVAQISFTNAEPNDWTAPCPSEWFRNADVRDRWPGNVARPSTP